MCGVTESPQPLSGVDELEEWPHTCVGIKYVFGPFHALVASRERRHLLDSSWPQCWMMPASFSHGSEIATVVSCCLAWRFEMPLS